MTVDTQSEVDEVAERMELVPLELAGLDEADLLAMFPTPVQAAGALVWARATNANAPRALNEYRKKLRKAQRDKKIAVGRAVKELRAELPRATLTELRELAYGADDRVIAALDAEDDAWLAYEYAKDYAAAIKEDIEILRSINANFRGEHR
ncbi:hypothetical protein CQ047_11255 [Microbacterium sp. MYb72]|uniref:hypothetical protein n=1 Tax=Microbacterium sp. MYb72 TaxID=1848693 RepID=UPI000CFB2CF2|nr:hypothetical protein [Microbacterium sp. MYb72]PRB09248.1 hypothetical protein CQ047_11255 [Microbacterium sp. MYb72]